MVAFCRHPNQSSKRRNAHVSRSAGNPLECGHGQVFLAELGRRGSSLNAGTHCDSDISLVSQSHGCGAVLAQPIELNPPHTLSWNFSFTHGPASFPTAGGFEAKEFACVKVTKTCAAIGVSAFRDHTGLHLIFTCRVSLVFSSKLKQPSRCVIVNKSRPGSYKRLMRVAT